MSASEILYRAADLIEERGWAKDWYCDDAGGLCAIGAMYAAVGVEPLPYVVTDGTEERWPTWSSESWSMVREAQNALETFLGSRSFGTDAPGWNDDEERTKEEVVEALREAAGAER